MWRKKKSVDKKTKIRNRELEIRQLYEERDTLGLQRDQYEKNGELKMTWLFDVVYNSNSNKIHRLENKIKAINKTITKLLYTHRGDILEIIKTENEELKKLNDTNEAIIYKKTIQFVRNPVSQNSLGSHAQELMGKFDKKGYLRCKASNVHFPMWSYKEYEYPSGYIGSLNTIGQVWMRINKTDSYYSGKFPKQYIGSIDKNGQFMVETKREFLEPGSVYLVSSLLGKVYFGSSYDEREFFQNRKKIIEIIDQFRESIT